MTVVFASNYFNHHQSGISRELDRLTDHHYTFIETMPMEAERRDMGWGVDTYPDYVLRSYAPGGLQRSRELIQQADAVIWGSCPFSMILPRLLKGKLTILYSERIFRSGKIDFMFLARSVKHLLMLLPFQRNHYLLCSSAYSSADYGKLGLFRGRAFRWGYFPEFLEYDEAALAARKDPRSILWTARLIPLKHPEYAIETARRLKADGLDFRMELIGGGPMEQQLRDMVSRYGLEDQVTLSGSAAPEAVRQKMEAASVFLFTSDQNEGWGAVVNESMNSGCAVISSRTAGAAPFLIQDAQNGYLIDQSDLDALYRRTRLLIEQPELARKLGTEAYRTIAVQWNTRCAADRLIKLIASITENGSISPFPDNGPCSTAPIMKE